MNELFTKLQLVTIKKIILLIIMFFYYFQLYPQDVQCSYENICVKDLIPLGKDLYVKMEIRKDGVYSNVYYKYEDTLKNMLKINSNTDILNIIENKAKYFALVRDNDSILLFQTEKKNIDWIKFAAFKDQNDRTDFAVSEDNIVIFSKERLYYNFSDRNKFDSLSLKNDSIRMRLYGDINSVLLNNTLFISNDQGEFGGELYKLVYDRMKKSFNIERLFNENITKLFKNKNKIYALCLLTHLETRKNKILKINNNETTVIYSNKNSGDENIKSNIDIYNWGEIFSDKLILNISNYKNELFLLVENMGVFKINKYNQPILIQSIEKTSREEKHNGKIPYISTIRIEDIRVYDNKIYLFERSPAIIEFDIKLSR